MGRSFQIFPKGHRQKSAQGPTRFVGPRPQWTLHFTRPLPDPLVRSPSCRLQECRNHEGSAEREPQFLWFIVEYTQILGMSWNVVKSLLVDN